MDTGPCNGVAQGCNGVADGNGVAFDEDRTTFGRWGVMGERPK